jgi:hypothetical protein
MTVITIMSVFSVLFSLFIYCLYIKELHKLLSSQIIIREGKRENEMVITRG